MISFHIHILKDFLESFSTSVNDSKNYFLRGKIYEYIPEPAVIQKIVPCCVIKHQPGQLEVADSIGLVRDTTDESGNAQTEILRSRYLQTTLYAIDFWLSSLVKEVTQDTITNLIYLNFSNLSTIKNRDGTITEFVINSLGIVEAIEENTYRKLVLRCEFTDVIYHKNKVYKLPKSIQNYSIGVK